MPTNAQVKQNQAALQDSSKSVKCKVIDYHINYHEFKYEKDFSSTDLKIDNLKKHLPLWETVLIANDFVIVINTGYLIPYIKDPTSAYLEKKNKSTLTHTSFVQTSVSMNSTGKERLILDLRHVCVFKWQVI